MTTRRALVVGLLCAALLTSGCLGTPTTGATTTPDGQTPDGTSTPSTDDPSTVTPTTGPLVRDYEAHVFDHAGIDGPVVDGGIRYPTDGEYTAQQYVTVIANVDEAGRFNESRLPSAAAAFVANTTFETESLVVIQTFPASSHPDYRVESVRRDGGTLRVSVDRSSRIATDDITVETLLLRVSGDAPQRVEVTTDSNTTVDSDGGIITAPQTQTPTPMSYRIATPTRSASLPTFGLRTGPECRSRGRSRGTCRDPARVLSSQ